MDRKKVFSLENFEFIDDVKDQNFLSKICIYVGFKILTQNITWAFFSHLYSPIRLSNIIEFENGVIEHLARITNLNESIELDASLKNSIIKSYDQRLMMMIGQISLFYIIGAYPMILIIGLGLFWFSKKLQLIPTNFVFQSLIDILVFYLKLIPFVLINSFFALIVVAIVTKIIGSLVIRQFAAILCVTYALYIVIELNRDEILINPIKRINLVNRITSLAQATLFLPQYYKQSSQYWLEEHFKNIAFYILERGRWAIVPTQSTLDDLRRDFYKLAEMYITGKYGEFKWINMPSTSQPKSNWKTQLLITVPQLLNVAIPVILLIPSVNSQIKINGVQSGILSLILISWLLVSVDSILKLGIIKNFIDLSKGIKDLK